MESARGMEERFAVTAATGALGPVLVKLAALLGDEYKLQEGTRRGIESMKSELEPVHHLLGKLCGRDDLDVACKDWMEEARELSYDMEDGIDLFTRGLEHGDGGFIQRWTTDDGPLKEFMERVKEVSEQCGKMEKVGNAICNRSNLTTDPRALFLHKDASELVGMEEKKVEVIRLLQKHEMVCIFGSAGMGKTTLVDLVYQTIGDQFQCQAFVSVHPSPNMTEILGTILRQVTDGALSAGSGTESAAEQKSGTEPGAVQNDFIKGISNFLSDKRYLVIIDDIWHWEEWEVIRKALPKNDLGCKLIMTTRVRSIAEKCETEQGAWVYEQKFGYQDAARLSYMRLSKSVEGTNAKQLSTKIVAMCGRRLSGCCPLAVICLSSAWAESHHVPGDDGEFETWASQVLSDGFLITPSLKPLVQSLCLGFDYLPLQLRTCLLYCTIYHPQNIILHRCMVTKWIVEGFVSHVDVANSFLEELADRNLLQPYSQVTYNSEAYRVQPIMRAFLVCKAKQDNFIAYNNDGPGNSSHAKQIRRLCVTTGRYPDEDALLADTRTLVVSALPCQLDCKAFKKLLVLEICQNTALENGDLVDICGLIRLKYLGIWSCHQITELPGEIGRLQDLESLYVVDTHISKLPKEIKNLERLETLDISWTLVRELPKEIGELQHLRTLDITGTKVRELPWEVQNSLNVLVGDNGFVKTVKVAEAVIKDRVISSSGAISRGLISIVFLDPLNKRCELLQIPLLRVDGRHMKVPEWVKQDLCNVRALDISLCKLVEEDLEFLKTTMPSLQALLLRFAVLPREPVAITGGGFSRLETFYVDCRLPRVTFKREAMPKLKHLVFKFYTGTESQGYYMGIKHLVSLEKVVFRCSKYYTSDGPGIRETIDVLRKEAVEHPNKITLWVNHKQPEAFGTDAKWLSLADKAIVEKREKLFRAAEKRAEEKRAEEKRA